MDSREGSTVSLSPKIRICQLRRGRLQLDYFLVNCLWIASADGQRKVL